MLIKRKSPRFRGKRDYTLPERRETRPTVGRRILTGERTPEVEKKSDD